MLNNNFKQPSNVIYETLIMHLVISIRVLFSQSLFIYTMYKLDHWLMYAKVIKFLHYDT